MPDVKPIPPLPPLPLPPLPPLHPLPPLSCQSCGCVPNMETGPLPSSTSEGTPQQQPLRYRWTLLCFIIIIMLYYDYYAVDQ